MPEKKSVKKTLSSKVKSKPAKTFYYRLFFDDHEKKNYMKSRLTHKQVDKYLKSYEKTHQKFLNSEFVAYLRQYDKKTEMIEISDISY